MGSANGSYKPASVEVGYCARESYAGDVEEVVPEGLVFGGFVRLALLYPAEGVGMGVILAPRPWDEQRLPCERIQTTVVYWVQQGWTLTSGTPKAALANLNVI